MRGVWRTVNGVFRTVMHLMSVFCLVNFVLLLSKIHFVTSKRTSRFTTCPLACCILIAWLPRLECLIVILGRIDQPIIGK